MSTVAVTAALIAEAGYGSPDEWRFVLAGWGLISGGIGAYALAVVLKGRKLSKELPPEKRRWMS